jgi:putative tricarboxylic transport membrane protein
VPTSIRRLEVGTAVVLLALGGSAAWEALRMPQGTPALPGPGMVPLAFGVLLALAAALLIGVRRTGSGGDEAVPLGHRHVVLAFTVLIVAGLLWERAGFLVTSALFLFVMLWSLSPLGWWRSLLFAVAGSVALRLIFQNLLNVVLPPLPFTS